MNLSREFFIPKGSVKVCDKQSDAVAYVYERVGVLYAAIFFGKQTKPVAHYRFKSAAQREKEVVRYFEARRSTEAYKAKRSSERKAWVNDYKVGEIVNTCWGYDQTNREFYEIVGVKGKHVTLRQIAITSFATGWVSEKVSPLASQFIGEAFTRLAQDRGIKIGQHSHTYATRTSFTETVPGVKVYNAGHTSSYA